jgi:hypothetical protein
VLSAKSSTKTGGQVCGLIKIPQSQIRNLQSNNPEPYTLYLFLTSLCVPAAASCLGEVMTKTEAESDAVPVLRSFLTSIAFATEVSEAGSVANSNNLDYLPIFLYNLRLLILTRSPYPEVNKLNACHILIAIILIPKTPF